MTIFISVCSYCKKDLNKTVVKNDGKKETVKSHGICKACMKDLEDD